MPANKSHAMGSGGFCVCPKCGFKAVHRQGIPCQDERCPGCNAKMLREGSDHHKKFLARRAN